VALISVRLKGWWGSADVVLTDESVYDSAEVKPLGATAQEGEGTAVRRVQCVFTRTPTGSVEDVAVCTLDFMNMTGGDPDDSWTSGDFATMEGLLDTFWTAVTAYQNSKCALTSYRWYRIGPAIVKPNPAVRITAKTITGAQSQVMPPQVAISVTEKTAVRRAWGRFYIPGIAANTSTYDIASGRIASGAVAAIHAAALALYDGAAAADFLPVVYSRTKSKVYGVEKIQVDDLFDVQRPRRWDRPLIRTVGDVGP
jgi:hypothetical protein